jgi:Zn-dependent protease
MLILSFLITVAIYSFIFKSFWLALAVFSLLGVHELGHVIAMNQKGIGVRRVIFIPFLGAAAIPQNRMNAEEEEWAIGLAGPLAGMIGSFACFFLALATGSDVLMRAAKLSGLINLFNLLPIYPLDGGRVAKALGVSVWQGFRYVLLAVGGALSILVAIRTFVLILPFFAYIGWRELERNKDMRPMRLGKVVLGVVSELAVAFALMVLLYLTRGVKVL